MELRSEVRTERRFYVRSLLATPLRAGLAASLTLAGFALGTPGCGGYGTADLHQLATPAARTKVAASAERVREFTGELRVAGEFLTFDAGPSEAGDVWQIGVEVPDDPSARLAVGLLDADDVLLVRNVVANDAIVTHALYRATLALRVVVVLATDAPVRFALTAGATPSLTPPPPRGQVVWLNFAGSTEVTVQGRTTSALAPFDAASLGPAYAGQTEWFVAEITRLVQSYYAPFNVTILSSDERGRPAEPHSTVYFGGTHDQRLGMSDGVDRGNNDPRDQAIVYVERFAAYASMDLSPEEMAYMVANTAAHELGHLLGLYHTRGEGHLMNDDESAWKLTRAAHIAPSAVSPAVFPVGIEDAARVLGDALGWRDTGLP